MMRAATHGEREQSQHRGADGDCERPQSQIRDTDTDYTVKGLLDFRSAILL
jgi:hypothetical protein